ncbi:MAG: DNA methyltransferase, partial [Chloroflexota bacterium]|nr:DNA methyltransferase [Chloroflexota bacterium]
ALLHGDCRHMVEVADASVDLVITDPPFNVSGSHGRRSFDFGEGPEADCISPEEYGRWTAEWITECMRVLKPGGQLYAIMSLKMMPWWLPEVRERNWHLLAWAKTTAFFHRHKTYLRAWEPILWVVKGESPNVLHRTYRFEDDRDWLIGPNASGEAEGAMSRLKKRHPTPRPDWIYQHFILRASDPGMVVMDPMMGSGTGARVARKLGRNFIGYDINRDYVDLAVQLIAQGLFSLDGLQENISQPHQLDLMAKWEATESKVERDNKLAQLPGRFRAKLKVIPSGCWEWQGGTTHDGYGLFRALSTKPMVLAHRFAYQVLIGEIDHGLELDHQCRNPRCVNPAHLAPITHQENVARGLVAEANRARRGERRVRKESHNGGDGPEGAGGEVQGQAAQPGGAGDPQQ